MKKERPQAADISSTAKQPTLDTRSLRSALGRFTTGVTVITARGPDGRLVGVTANSFNSVSLDPPLVLWSLARRSGSLSAFQGASHWAVHILTHDQSDLSAHFAKPSDDKFSGLPVSYSLEGTPLLNNCAARFLCRSAHHYDGGDHLILVGEVVQFERNDLPPLVYHDSNYAIATNVVAHGQPPVLPDTPSAGSFGYLLGSAFFYIFGQLREAAGKMGLNNIELFILTAILERPGRSRKEIDALLAYAGHGTSMQVLDDLEARGLLSAREGKENDQDSTEFNLTAEGRELAERISQVAANIEEHMQELLGISGAIALRTLLQRFVRDTTNARSVDWL